MVLNSWFWALVADLGQIFQVLGLDQQEVQAELRIPWERIYMRGIWFEKKKITSGETPVRRILFRAKFKSSIDTLG